MARIETAKYAGFCFGVARAAKLIEAESAGGLYTIGELIHNKSYVDRLKSKGVFPVSLAQALQMPAGTRVAIRTHGIPKEDEAALAAAGLSVLDATCPYVKKVQETADKFTSNGEDLLIMGDGEHPEVKGIRSYAHGESYVFSSAKALEGFFAALDDEKKAFFEKIAPVLVSQTTFSLEEWQKSRLFLKKLYTNAKIFDTICDVTERRQKEAARLSAECGLVVVVGGKNSSNTRRLFETAAKNCKTVHVETASELPEALAGAKVSTCGKIAIAAGASTPFSIIQEVAEQMEDIIKTEAEGQDEPTFQEMLDQNFKTLHTGERVCGTVSSVTPAEVHVDLGTKHTGILPYDEITDEGGLDLSEMFKVGDKIEVIPVKFNDAEGTVQLSKKRLDSFKNWNMVVEAGNEHTVLQGVVKDIVKGGIIVSTSGVKVFVPASQSGVPKGEPLEPLRGKTVSFKVIEINEQRKRAVGSIRLALRSERKKAIDEFFASVQVGQKFTGVVRSLTSYGAFINLGPVDGMAHITELSWGRLRPPTEIFKIGDQVDVYIKAINPETKRISLGYKTEENNPWNIFAAKFNVGDDIRVKVVNLMSFGAFAEIIPGVDGLIHNTQLAARPVSSPSSVVSVGDEIDVRIIAIDKDRRRISLSRRALLPIEELTAGFEMVEGTPAHATVVEAPKKAESKAKAKPEAEKAAPEAEAAAPEAEAAAPEAEEAAPEAEAAAPESEAAVPESEAAAPESEAAAPESEAAAPESEAAAPEAKAAAPESEEAAPEAETAAPEAEAAAPESEAAVPESEAAAPEAEAAAPESEAAAPESEAAAPEAEAAAPESEETVPEAKAEEESATPAEPEKPAEPKEPAEPENSAE